MDDIEQIVILKKQIALLQKKLDFYQGSTIPYLKHDVDFEGSWEVL